MKHILPLLMTLISLNLTAQNGNDSESDVEAVKKLVREYYWNVMYTNDERKEVAAIAEGFDENFHMYVYYQNELSVRTRDEWMAILQSNRDKAKIKPSNKPKRNNNLEFGFIDVTGQTAVAKLLISSNGKMKYTDDLTYKPLS